MNNCTDTRGRSAKDDKTQSFLDHIQNNFWIKTRDIFGANTKKSIFVNLDENWEMSRTPKSDKGKYQNLCFRVLGVACSPFLRFQDNGF